MLAYNAFYGESGGVSMRSRTDTKTLPGSPVHRLVIGTSRDFERYNSKNSYRPSNTGYYVWSLGLRINPAWGDP